MNKCDVFIWEQKVGQLLEVNERIYFKYSPDFNLNISPIKMPPSPQQYGFKNLEHQYGLPGVFYECLPDSFGMDIINDYFEKVEKNYEPTIIDKLLFIGNARLGALRFEPSYQSAQSPSEIIINAKELYTKAKHITQNKSYDASEILEVYQSFSPLGGARAKALVGFSKETKMFYVGANPLQKGFVPSIVKLDERALGKPSTQTINEFIIMKCAQSVGIDIPDIYLLHDNGYDHFIIERFDINKEERVHRASISSLNDYNFKQKWYGYEHIFRTMVFLNLPEAQMSEMYRRMVFNYVYNNHDDHLKNHSLVMNSSGEWSLSKAYDITYLKSAGHMNQWLLINGKKSSQVTKQDFIDIAKLFKIKNSDDIIDEVENGADYLKQLVSEYMPDDYQGEAMLADINFLHKKI